MCNTVRGQNLRGGSRGRLFTS